MQNMTEYESKQVSAIEAWKREEPSVVSQTIGTVLKPVSWLMERIIPSKAIEGALTLSNTAAECLADKGDILRDGRVSSIGDLKTKSLELSDELANSVHNWAIGVASAEGGAAGAFGLAGMAVDIPTLITLCLREIHKIGLCYGFECKTEMDQRFVLGVLSVAGANSVKEKNMSLLTLKQISTMLTKMTWKKITEAAAKNKYGLAALIVLIKQLAKQLGINVTKRKALQAIPILGAGVGAAMNASMLRDVGWAARRSFQERWLMENGKIVLSDEDK